MIGGKCVAKAASGGVVIGGSTYAPAYTAQIAGTPLSVGSIQLVSGELQYLNEAECWSDTL